MKYPPKEKDEVAVIANVDTEDWTFCQSCGRYIGLSRWGGLTHHGFKLGMIVNPGNGNSYGIINPSCVGSGMTPCMESTPERESTQPEKE